MKDILLNSDSTPCPIYNCYLGAISGCTPTTYANVAVADTKHPWTVNIVSNVFVGYEVDVCFTCEYYLFDSATSTNVL